MAFTDDDLKWLKDDLKTAIESWAIGYTMPCSVEQTKALLARLESAERVVREANYMDGDKRPLALEKALEAWRKTAGK